MTEYTRPLPSHRSISALKLDPNNRRLLLHGSGTSESELISRLCSLKNSNTPIRILRNIESDNAFIHSLTPHVLKIGKHYTVVDGNSRVAALKMILNPSLIPPNRHKLRKDCERLAGLIPEKIPCWICLDKSKAQRIVYRIHNEGSKEWESLSKYSVYYDDFLHRGLSVQEIADYAGIKLTPATIAQKINTWQLIEYLVEYGEGFLRDSSNIT